MKLVGKGERMMLRVGDDSAVSFSGLHAGPVFSPASLSTQKNVAAGAMRYAGGIKGLL